MFRNFGFFQPDSAIALPNASSALTWPTGSPTADISPARSKSFF
jgi:hypothetical protein